LLFFSFFYSKNFGGEKEMPIYFYLNLREENEKCSECGGKVVKTSEGELVCSSCGLVYYYELIP
jgi:ribosomal protein S27AE